MADNLINQYLSLDEKTAREFRKKFWMVSPNLERFSTPETDNHAETELGDVHYGNGIYYITNKYGIDSTGYFTSVWRLENHEKKNETLLFELKHKPRYSEGKFTNIFIDELHYYEFILDDSPIEFATSEPIRDFKTNGSQYYAETDNYYICLPDNITVSKQPNGVNDPYQLLDDHLDLKKYCQ